MFLLFKQLLVRQLTGKFMTRYTSGNRINLLKMCPKRVPKTTYFSDIYDQNDKFRVLICQKFANFSGASENDKL